MLDIKFVRENPDIVKENIKKKFQDAKLPLVDEVISIDAELRAAKTEADELRAIRNKTSKEIGALMGQGKKEEAEAVRGHLWARGGGRRCRILFPAGGERRASAAPASGRWELQQPLFPAR